LNSTHRKVSITLQSINSDSSKKELSDDHFIFEEKQTLEKKEISPFEASRILQKMQTLGPEECKFVDRQIKT
jgi:hypothetical protein